MANEITIQLNFSVANSGYSVSERIKQSYTQNTLGADASVTTVTTTATTYAFADLATYGWALFQNLDPTNYVQLGLSVSAAFTPFARVEPGEIALFRIEPGVTFQMKAHTASVKINYLVLND